MIRYEEQLPKLASRVQRYHEAFLDLIENAIVSELGEPLERCQRCTRPMLPRRSWDSMTLADRDKLRGLIVKCNSRGICVGCTRNNLLSDTELAKLRKDVGVK
jgi:hypothetical protein